MLACVVGLLPSLLYLAPVIAMVAFVVVAKIRGTGYEDEESSVSTSGNPNASKSAGPNVVISATPPS
jgi:hypothetical protein